MNQKDLDDAEEYQADCRKKLEDLLASAQSSNHEWNAWELEFIESVCEKLDDIYINLSTKQIDKVWDLWEKL